MRIPSLSAIFSEELRNQEGRRTRSLGVTVSNRRIAPNGNADKAQRASREQPTGPDPVLLEVDFSQCPLGSSLAPAQTFLAY